MGRNQDAGKLHGASGPVRISRGEGGVAEIDAEDLGDALLGLGYCHARDRALQMLFVRILGRGEASLRLRSDDEMFALDRDFRRLDLGRDSVAQWLALSDRGRSGLDAYCRGINLGFERFGVPWELRALGFRLGADVWTFADVALTGKIIGYMYLALNQASMERWIVEAVRSGIGRDQLEEMFPGQLEGLDESLLRQLHPPGPAVPEALGSVPGLPLGSGSNNWVVAGSKTESGRPLMANDPHLQINRLPAVWYEAVLRWRSDGRPRYAVGASMPGTPGLPIGRTADLAWSVTYAYMDCVDSWIEDCRDAQYRRNGGWKPMRIRDELVRRRGKNPVRVRFFETETHGTLEGDPQKKPGLYLATRWSCGEQTGADATDGLLGILEAGSVAEGRALLGRVNNSSWNWLLADRDGAIGYQMSGKMPLRRQGVSGLVPLPGWDPANDWQGFATPEDLPRSLDPPEGFLATANDDLNALGRLHPINICAAPYRAGRIRSVLKSSDGLSVESMKALQFDVYSAQAERFMELVRPLLDETGPSPNAALLRDWDLCYHDDSRGAFLFERFYNALVEDVFGSVWPVADTSGPGPSGGAADVHPIRATTVMGELFVILDRILLSEQSAWFGARTRSEIYRLALKKALAAEPRPYGESRRFRLLHLLFGGLLPRALGFDRGPVALRGGRATVHQGQILSLWGRPVVWGPSYRAIADLAADSLHTTLPGGPTDRRFSRWYASGLSDWRDGRYKTLLGPSPEPLIPSGMGDA